MVALCLFDAECFFEQHQIAFKAFSFLGVNFFASDLKLDFVLLVNNIFLQFLYCFLVVLFLVVLFVSCIVFYFYTV